MNFASDSLINPIAARFLFTAEQYLLAIAEVPAKEVRDYSQRDIENLYKERREKQPGKSHSSVYLIILQLCSCFFEYYNFKELVTTKETS